MGLVWAESENRSRTIRVICQFEEGWMGVVHLIVDWHLVMDKVVWE